MAYNLTPYGNLGSGMAPDAGQFDVMTLEDLERRKALLQELGLGDTWIGSGNDWAMRQRSALDDTRSDLMGAAGKGIASATSSL